MAAREVADGPAHDDRGHREREQHPPLRHVEREVVLERVVERDPEARDDEGRDERTAIGKSRDHGREAERGAEAHDRDPPIVRDGLREPVGEVHDGQ